MSRFVNAPCCEACWIDRNSTWAGDVLTHLRVPVRVTNIEFTVERCGYCGGPTFSGIYQRVAAEEAPHHREDDDVDPLPAHLIDPYEDRG